MHIPISLIVILGALAMAPITNAPEEFPEETRVLGNSSDDLIEIIREGLWYLLNAGSAGLIGVLALPFLLVLKISQRLIISISDMASLSFILIPDKILSVITRSTENLQLGYENSTLVKLDLFPDLAYFIWMSDTLGSIIESIFGTMGLEFLPGLVYGSAWGLVASIVYTQIDTREIIMDIIESMKP